MCSFFATESFTEMTSAINHLPMCNQQNEKITAFILYDNCTDELFKRLQVSIYIKIKRLQRHFP